MVTTKNDGSTPRSVRQGEIIEYLRGQVVRGRLLPGERMPSHRDLCKRFSTTPVTVQRALLRLQEDGFAVPEANRGTFVAPFPPHLFRYALVFPSANLAGERWRWSRYWTAMEAAAAQFEQATPMRFVSYHHVSDRECDAYKRLEDDVDNKRLTGVIVAFNPGFLGLPRFMMKRTIPVTPLLVGNGKMEGLQLDFHGMRRRVLERLAAEGRKRVGVIALHAENVDYFTREECGLQAQGLTTHAHWFRGVHPDSTWWIKHAIADLMDRPASRRPDALFVTDDHLLEATADAVEELGISPGELSVSGHWNFPLPFNGKREVTRIGFDLRVFLRMSLEILDAQRRGVPMPSLLVPSQFCDEVNAEAAIGKEIFSCSEAS